MDRHQARMAGDLEGEGNSKEMRWPRELQTSQQWCWQKAQRAPLALTLFHTDFFHSVHVSFYFYTWTVARIRRGDRKRSAFQLNEKHFAIVSELI